MSSIEYEVRRVKRETDAVHVQKLERLKNMDFFCLDNSIRESTVGQLRSHTLQNKIQIFEQVKKCGIEDIVVATFSHMTRVDDDFVEHLVDIGEDFTNLYSFSEVSEGIKDGAYDTKKIPIGLKKNKKFGLRNTIFEVDLGDKNCEWGVKFTVDDMCKLILERIKWAKTEVCPSGRVLLNLRDFPFAVAEDLGRVLAIVKFVSSLPEPYKLFGMLFEDPGGECMPEELAAWTASVRRIMDANGWKDGKLLAHIHQKWDLQTAAQLDCLSAGADGIWASLCEEGAAMGHACSSVTMMNLVRMGNKKILKKYNCTQLRNAAQAITKITTTKEPHPKQCLYGERAVDLVISGLGVGDFDIATFFGVETPNRITTLASTDMIKETLITLFGKNPQFTDEIALNMKEKMLEDLRNDRKEEYMSKVGIALLFDRSGGKLTGEISDIIAKEAVSNPHHKALIAEIRQLWDSWDVTEEKVGDDCLQYDSFYHGFMAPYFGCYRCIRTKKGLQAIDMDSDGLVNWKEFMVYIKWALHEYPETDDADDLMSIVFQKGLIPAMRDEHYKGVKNMYKRI